MSVLPENKLIVCWTKYSILIVYACCVYQGWASMPGLSMDYFLYTEKRSWNEARSVCQSINGDLAKLDSQDVIDFLYLKAEEGYSGALDNQPYWIGLVHLNESTRRWVEDCSNLSPSNVYNPTYAADQLCYKIDNINTGLATSCSENNAFLCERQSAGPCTTFRTMFENVNIALVSGVASKASCEALCRPDANCQYVMFVSPDKCYQFSIGTGSPSASLSYKFCASFYENTTNTSPPGDNSDVPNNYCGNYLAFPPASASSILPPSALPTSSFFSTSAADNLVSCSPVVLTEMVTAHVTEIVSSPCECIVPTVLLTTTLTDPMTSACARPASTASITTTVSSPVSCQSSSAPTPACVLPSNSSTVALNLSSEQELQVAEEIKKNLTVDVKTTSSYIRSLTSAQDFRTTATAMGIVGVVCIAAPLAFLVALDSRRFLDDIRGFGRQTKEGKR